MIEEYKDKLGTKMETFVFPQGKETFAINIYENGFILRKRKQQIVLDRISLWKLKDLIEHFENKMKIVKSL